MPQPQGNRQKDQRQQVLRNQKKQWSASVSTLISKLIEFKKGLNGRGSAKIGIEPSRIQNALPESVNANLQQLAGEFQKVVSDAEGIIAAQQNYSATRRKRKPKQPKVPQQPNAQAPAPAEAPAAPAAEANPLASLSSFNAEIEKLGSNRLTRFWEYLTSVFSRREYNRERLGMLSLSSKLFYDMLDFENDVLKLNKNSIPGMMNKFQNMKNTYLALEKQFLNVSKHMATTAKKEGVSAPSADDTKIDINSIKMELNKLVQQYQAEENSFDKKSLYEKIQEKHKELKLLENVERSLVEKTVSIPSNPGQKEKSKPQKPQVINLDESDGDSDDPNSTFLDQVKFNVNKMNDKGMVDPKDLKEIVHMINSYEQDDDPHTKDIWLKQIREEYNNLTQLIKNKKADIINDNMVKVSHNALTRFLRKQLVKARSYDETAAPRLQAADMAVNTKKIVKRLMDVLEKDLTIEEVSKSLGEIKKQIVDVADVVAVLSILYKEKFSGENHESDKDLNIALRRRVRRDLLQNLI